MDEWDDDAYTVIYDEQGRERTVSSNTGSDYTCCGVIVVFVVIAILVAVLL